MNERHSNSAERRTATGSGVTTRERRRADRL